MYKNYTVFWYCSDSLTLWSGSIGLRPTRNRFSYELVALCAKRTKQTTFEIRERKKLIEIQNEK